MFYKLAKIIYILFIFYITWFQQVFLSINNAPLILGVGMIGSLLLHKLSTRKGVSFLVTKPIFIWVIFSLYIFFAGYIVSYDKVVLINSVFTFIQYLAMMIFIIDVSKHEGSNSFFVKSYAILAVIYALTILVWGYENQRGQITVSATSNPNTDGMIMLYGIFCLLILLDFKKSYQIIISYISMGILFYTIILTASRKSFLAVVLLFLLWFIFVLKDYWKISSIKIKLLGTLTLLILGIALAKHIPTFISSTLYTRLTEGYGYSGDEYRILMYKIALEYFKSSPLFGIGFNQFRILFGGSSHSTYAEVISCTGIIGTILYFIPYLIIVYNIFLIYYNRKKTVDIGQSTIYLILMIVMLFLAAGVILFYDISSNIMFALMISFYYNFGLKSRLSIKSDGLPALS